MALNLPSPWFVKSIDFKEEQATRKKHLYIDIGFKRGHIFEKSKKTHDTQARSWRHLNFFEHECHLTCNVPRLKDNQGKVALVQVPWARKGSGFTLPFEAMSMALIENEMPVNKAARILHEYPQRIWNIFNYWISIAYV